MEQEIDLRPYVHAVARQWRLILGVALVAAMVAAAITMALPRPAVARGDVLVIARTSQLTLDPRFVDRDATMITNTGFQRQALIDLASSSALEARVAEQLGLSSYRTGELLGRVSISSRSDLLRVEASAATPEEARRLADAWGSAYEAFVDEVYGTSVNAFPEDPLDQAQQSYTEAQSALSSFYTSGELVRAQQAVIRAAGVLTGSVAAQMSLYTGYLTRTQELNLILEDARALQAQYEAGGADPGASLAALVVRARLAGADRLPVVVNIDSAATSAVSQADLADFVRILEAERDRRVAEVQALAAALAAGDGTAVGLPSDVRARYETDLAAAWAALSQAEAQERRLLLERDVALRALEVLQAKRNERQVDQAVPEVSVRFVGAAVQPPRSVLVPMIVNGVAAAAVSSAFVVAFVIGRELLRQTSAPRAGALASPERAAADKPVATD